MVGGDCQHRNSDNMENLDASLVDTSDEETITTQQVEMASNEATQATSASESTSSGGGMTSWEIPFTCSESSSNGFRRAPYQLSQQLQPIYEKLEAERKMLLERDEAPDAPWLQYWVRVTNERDHLLRICFCQNTKSEIAEEVARLDRMCARLGKQVVCPEPIMGYLRRILKKIRHITPLVMEHLTSEQGHENCLSKYSEISPGSFNTSGSSDPEAKILAVRKTPPFWTLEPPPMNPGPSTSTGALPKYTAKNKALNPYLRDMEALSKSEAEYFFPKHVDLSAATQYPSSCIPTISSEEKASLGSTSGKFGSRTDSSLVFEFADAHELGLRRISAKDNLSQSLTPDSSIGNYFTNNEQPRSETEVQRSPVSFYLSDEHSSSAPFESCRIRESGAEGGPSSSGGGPSSSGGGPSSSGGGPSSSGGGPSSSGGGPSSSGGGPSSSGGGPSSSVGGPPSPVRPASPVGGNPEDDHDDDGKDNAEGGLSNLEDNHLGGPSNPEEGK